ncbi:hypothetical protein LCGC14_2248940 [marine sediment metagenome]|uniref:Uncharacterized protein n=1 Tax=marine sediment metagenome TaxID=412755 RepID=A0A0F9D2X1_9ZZZZ
MDEMQLNTQEQGQVFTACWNERARLTKKLKGKTNRCSTNERIELLTNVIKKLKEII